jgi:diguanylate cyclase (GGDEF)-like protein/putative nucleotidyltransferase with HDIG domain
MFESDHRPDRIVTIRPEETLQQAAAKMLSHNVGCLIVNDPQGSFVGLVTERDVAYRVATAFEQANQPLVGDIMTDRVISCPPGTSTGAAREIMAEHRVRHLPVVENGVVVDILSARDVMARQRVEDRAAAEEVAMLSNCLKSIDLSEAAEIVTAEAPRLFGATNCVLCLYGEPGSPAGPELVSSNGCPCLEGHLEQPEHAAQVVGQAHLVDTQVPPACARQGGEPPRLILPLDIVGLKEVRSTEQKRLSGFICMCGLPAEATYERELITYKAGLAREIIVAHLTNATRYQQARLTSLTDTLTGVGSRKLLEDKLEAEFERARRYKRPFSVAIIDLDHFKLINDTLGHAAGDDAIRKLAACMEAEKRAPDVLARYGGDEFVVLMPETTAAAATVLLERIRVRAHQIRLEQQLVPSISCGVAESLPERDDGAREVMRRADLALYEAKNAGRNCVKLWDDAMAQRLNANDLEIEKIKKLQRRILGLSEKAEKMFMESIWGLVQALEAKDNHAKKHSENVMYYSVALAESMNLGLRHVDLIRRAAMIHDIGKIGIPDAILLKPEQLTPYERRIIEQHPLIAVRILEKMSFLEREIAIVRHHHEKWNGQGYPDGLTRTNIPLGARVVAVADTFDALTANRTYHESRTVSGALTLLKDSAGYDFDPDVVKAMVAWIEAVASESDKEIVDMTVDDLLWSQKAVETDLAVRMAPVEAAPTLA